MKRILLYTIPFLLFYSCRQTPILSLRHENKGKIIALQPFGAFDEQKLKFLSIDLSAFFHAPVICLKEAEIPQALQLNNKEVLYADTILDYLAKNKPDSITIIIGLTHRSLITKADEDRGTVPSLSPPEAKIIYGLSYVKGSACIVSDNELALGGDLLFNDRVYKVILHEMGHILGLQHCPNKTCLMSEDNNKLWMHEGFYKDYCPECRKKLN
jgi:archaemetzincin